MKKFLILFAAGALMLMTACNEKPAKNDAEDSKNPAASEQVDSTKAPKVNVEKAAPTDDGKDHTVAEFNTKEYQVRLENLADGTFRLSMWKAGQDKSGKPEQIVETKKCVMQGGNYLMKGDDGKVYVINSKAGAEQLTIMDNKNIVYNGGNGK